MNLTSQYLVNPKSRVACTKSLATYKSIRTTSTRLRLGQSRQILNLKEKKGWFRVGRVTFRMTRCPIGNFKMGNSNNLTKIERPFSLGETEVTQELFETIMGYNPSNFQGSQYPNSRQRPVEQVTWYEALIFCNKLSMKFNKKPYYIIPNLEEKSTIENTYSYKNQEWLKKLRAMNYNDVKFDRMANGFRLPKALEWEYVAMAGAGNQWTGTKDENQLESEAWFDKNSNQQTHPVKCKLPNEWGFYDMKGNVYEWCWDLGNIYISYSRFAFGGSWNLSLRYFIGSEIPLKQFATNRHKEVGFRLLLP